MAKRFKNRDCDLLPRRFAPEFWADQDGRTPLPREIKRRVKALCLDAGADSEQKRLIAQRAVFLSLQLETAEVRAIRDGQLDCGIYTQQVNSLLGCLKALGLERKARKIGLKDYMQDKDDGD